MPAVAPLACRIPRPRLAIFIFSTQSSIELANMRVTRAILVRYGCIRYRAPQLRMPAVNAFSSSVLPALIQICRLLQNSSTWTTPYLL